MDNSLPFRNSLALMMFGVLYIISPSAFAAVSACPQTDVIAKNMMCQFGNFIDITVIIAYLLGTIFFIIGGLEIYKTSRNPNDSKGVIFVAFLVGTLLLGFGNVVTLYQDALFQTGDVYQVTQYNETLSRIKGGNDTQLMYVSSTTMRAIFGFAKFLGVLAMLKSLLIVWELGGRRRGGNATYGQLVAFAFGGVIAFRAEDFACLLADFFNMNSLCML